MAITGGTWTYSGDPAASLLDKARFLCGDTNTSDQRLSDEELLYLIGAKGNVWSAAAEACEQIAGQYASGPTSKAVGDLRIDYSQRVTELRTKAANLRVQGAGYAAPIIGGVSQADVDARVTNTDRVPNAISRGMHDNPEVGSSTGST